MGLDLNQNAIIEADELELNVVNVEDIEAELQAKGIHAFKKPSSQPQGLSELDVNELTNDELAALYSQFIAYQAFLSTEVARAKVEKSAADRNLKHVTAKLKAALHAKGVKEKEIPEKVRLHPLYLDYDLHYAEARYRFEILESYDRAYGKQAQALSRCVELRKIELEQSKRDGNLGKKGPGFGGKTGPITRPHRRKKSDVPKVQGKKKKKAAGAD